MSGALPLLGKFPDESRDYSRRSIGVEMNPLLEEEVALDEI